MFEFIKKSLGLRQDVAPEPAARGQPVETRRIVGVSVDPFKCVAHEACIHVTHDVFEFRQVDICAHVKDDASRHFESQHGLILRAQAECPVNAIKIQYEEPKPPTEPQ